MEILKLAIAEHPFGKNLEPRFLKMLAGGAAHVSFKQDQHIFREGEECDFTFLINSGSVAVDIYSPTKGAITIQTLSDGEVLGWSWLVPPFRKHFDARALEVVHAISIKGQYLRDLCEQDHDFGYELLKRFIGVVANRLQKTRLQLIDIYGDN
ncbi:MAG: cyclic nucleotide-binding domain-containing protein [bacterium]|nr:cyclic nucleotide-binding domain-containing protein [Candidatus Sumerlaeota bacterium]